MPERRTVQFKAPIAGKAQSNRYSQSIRFAHGLGPAHGASLSKAIAKIGNTELGHFNKQMLIHELIRGSLVQTNPGVIVSAITSAWPVLLHQLT